MFLQSNLQHATTKDELRPSMNCVHFRDGYALATNGHVLIKQCLFNIHNFSSKEVELLEGKSIHRDSFKYLTKKKSVYTITETGIEVLDGATKLEIKFSDEGKYPQFEQIINSILDDIKNGSKADNKISLNTDFFIAMSKSLYYVSSQKDVRQYLSAVNRGMIFTANNVPFKDQLAVVMPVMSGEWDKF